MKRLSVGCFFETSICLGLNFETLICCALVCMCTLIFICIGIGVDKVSVFEIETFCYRRGLCRRHFAPKRVRLVPSKSSLTTGTRVHARLGPLVGGGRLPGGKKRVDICANRNLCYETLSFIFRFKCAYAPTCASMFMLMHMDISMYT